MAAPSSREEGVGFDLLEHLSFQTGLSHRLFFGEGQTTASGPRADGSPLPSGAVECGVGILSRYPLSNPRVLEFQRWLGRPAPRRSARHSARLYESEGLPSTSAVEAT